MCLHSQSFEKRGELETSSRELLLHLQLSGLDNFLIEAGEIRVTSRRGHQSAGMCLVKPYDLLFITYGDVCSDS